MKRVVLVLGFIVGIVSCASAHEHHAPHQGTLVVLGKEFAHMEFVLDKKTGTLTAYALDGEAENSIDLAQGDIVVSVSPDDGTLSVDVTLKPVENPLTGEVSGNTSQFQGQADQLKGAVHFSAVIKDVLVKGEDFKNVSFDFPGGNEVVPEGENDHDDTKSN